MNKNRLFLAISVVSLLVMGMAVFKPFSRNSPVTARDTSDFYLRHPDWVGTANNQNAVVPITGEAAYPDYYQRHPELTIPSVIGVGASDAVDTTDYFFRHPELRTSGETIDTSDYFLRHPEFKTR